MTQAENERVEQHLTQWAHNREFLQEISTKYPDWIVTAALYLALHAIEALLTIDGARDRSSHKARLQILQQENRYHAIYKHYHILYDLAHASRYSANPRKWIPVDRIEAKIVKELIYPIENSIRRLIEKAKVGITMPDAGDISIKT